MQVSRPHRISVLRTRLRVWYKPDACWFDCQRTRPTSCQIPLRPTCHQLEGDGSPSSNTFGGVTFSCTPLPTTNSDAGKSEEIRVGLTKSAIGANLYSVRSSRQSAKTFLVYNRIIPQRVTLEIFASLKRSQLLIFELDSKTSSVLLTT